MDKLWATHGEHLLQYIWQNQLFDYSELSTTDGESIEIISPGELNATDGPDFLNARIRINGILWFGAIEIHLNERDWFHHGHHTDEHYNQVVLHVHLKPGKRAKLQNGSTIPSLDISTYLTDHLNTFIDYYQGKNSLPCSPIVKYLNTDVFEQQLAKAHKNYFEEHLNEFHSIYDTSLSPSQAFKKAYIISLFDGLGYKHNREAFKIIAEHIWPFLLSEMNWETFREKAIIQNQKLLLTGKIRWNHKNVRPHNHPAKRLEQGLMLAYTFYHQELKSMLITHPRDSWKELIQVCKLKSSNQRIRKLFSLIHLPGMYFLGSLFHANKLMQQSYSQWQNSTIEISQYILNPFKKAGLINTSTQQKAGLIYHWRSHCDQGLCTSCNVFKKVIQS